jgi:hypothetical protein
MAFHPSAGKALDKLRRWSERPGWPELLAEITASHVGPVTEVLRVSTEDLLGMLDQHFLEMITGAIFEDFARHVRGPRQHHRRIPRATRLERAGPGQEVARRPAALATQPLGGRRA